MFVTALHRRKHHEKWWLAGRVNPSSVDAVYNAAGASSYAAALVDLSGNSNDAATTYPGYVSASAPGFTASTGFEFDGVNEALYCPVAPNSASTMIVRFSGAQMSTNSEFICGSNYYAGAVLTDRFYLGATQNVDPGKNFFGYGGAFNPGVARATSGVMALTPTVGYTRGSSNTSLTGSWTGGGTRPPVGLAGIAHSRTTDIMIKTQVNIAAFALYNTTLTSQQIVAIMDAMAKL